MKRRVAVVSECQSKNLGDQAIAEAIVEILKPKYEVRNVSYGTVATQNPAGALHHADLPKSNQTISRLVSHVSPKTKALTKWHLLAEKKRFEEYLHSVVQEADLIIVGGGQLIKNNISLFCEKFALLTAIAAYHSTPFAIIGVGVDRKMRKKNWRTISDGMRNAKCTVVRDEISRKRINAALSCRFGCNVQPDVAFALRNPHRHRSLGDRNIHLAINVMDLSAMLNSSVSTGNGDTHSLMKGYCRIIEEASKTWSSITLFTSGSSADLHAATEIKEMAHNGAGVDLPVFHPETLESLLEFLGNVRDVFAARMHSGILAYVSGCNPLCINWDDKVEGVWTVVGEKRRVVSLSFITTEKAVKNLFPKLRALTSPSDSELDILADSVSGSIREAVVKAFDTPDVAQDARKL